MLQLLMFKRIFVGKFYIVLVYLPNEIGRRNQTKRI